MPQDVRPFSLVRDVADIKKTLRRHQAAITSILPCSQHGASYTLAQADVYTCVEFTGSGAQTCTVPANSSVPYPVGAWVEVRQFGTGQVTFAAAGGVTLRSPNGAVKTCTQYTTCVLHQRALNEWVIVGDLV